MNRNLLVEQRAKLAVAGLEGIVRAALFGKIRNPGSLRPAAREASGLIMIAPAQLDNHPIGPFSLV